MADITDLVSPYDLELMTDEELEQIVIHGRLAREGEVGGTAKRTRKAAAPKVAKMKVDLSKFK